VLELLAVGRTDKSIAKEMGISERTIGRRVANLMTRLNAKTRFELAYLAVKRSLI